MPKNYCNTDKFASIAKKIMKTVNHCSYIQAFYIKQHYLYFFVKKLVFKLLVFTEHEVVKIENESKKEL